MQPSAPPAAVPRDPTATLTETAVRPSWRQALKVYLEPASLRMLALGFSSGLPLLLVLGTFSFWLREASIDRSAIGHLSWIGLTYAFKWVWSPLVDRMPLPLLSRTFGQRRAWLLLSQCGVAAGLLGMAFNDPGQALQPVVWCALAVAFASATQDVALDAFRIESAGAERQAALAATYQTGYRLAMIWAGAGALALAALAEVNGGGYQAAAWRYAYAAMAASMLVGILTTLLSAEPAPRPPVAARGAAEWLRGTLIEPFADFFRRYGGRALLVLALIAVYRISDVVMGIMANPFYVDMGYTKAEVATVTKLYGVVMTLVGAFAGGALAMRLGVMRVLMLGALLSALTNLLFAWLGTRGHDVTGLVLVVAADNLAGGIATSAFVAYLSGLTNLRYSATQYALFSSLMLVLPKFLAGFSGDMVDRFGYGSFFAGTALLGLPVLALVALARRATPVGEARPARM
ncbi:AmpG family muropeptide MFS transporter [Xylophilus rhododendri]|uniref:AmpG family muropeptide MFS transporter n=1 Tax=Xylophilus rhododendri TaxID=2697032 RepID=A0A857J7K7_9BURK|nr:AmpG family muropeptide MFS transporter [Xylophilus rhododendri]QHI99041.1 AmpG family muropeptide MFS transporter [Xylophilus rhododendri]